MAHELDRDRLRADLKTLLVQRLRLRDVVPDSIGDDDALVRGPLGLDSIDMLDLALAVEERYRVTITDEQLAKEAFRSVAALADHIVKVRREPAKAAP